MVQSHGISRRLRKWLPPLNAPTGFLPTIDVRQDAERLKLFRQAAAAHIQYAQAAADAKGIDRHFFGAFPQRFSPKAFH